MSFIKKIFNKPRYYYVRYQNLTYGKGLEYTTVCTGTFAEIHKYCVQSEIAGGNKVANKYNLQILNITEITKEDYDYFKITILDIKRI